MRAASMLVAVRAMRAGNVDSEVRAGTGIREGVGGVVVMLIEMVKLLRMLRAVRSMRFLMEVGVVGYM